MKKYLLITLFLLLNACQTAMPPVPTDEQTHWAKAIDTRINLYQVDDKLFRSEQLSEKDALQLQQLQIKTIVNLRFFDRNNDKQAFANREMTFINTPLISWAISTKEVADVLWQIRQAQKQGAVLVHCYHGADRTGLIVAMYRVIYQNWPLEKAKAEMLQGPYGFHSIWQNMPNFFTEKNVAEIRGYLAQYR